MRGLSAAAMLALLSTGCGSKNEASKASPHDPHGAPAGQNVSGDYAGGSDGVEPASAICGEVRISAELAPKVTPAAILFVFSKAQLGPGAPAAVVRRESPAFPAKFCLSQKNSMAGASFSGAQFITARVEFDSSAGGQSGDPEFVTKEPVAVGTRDLVLTIDSVRP